jgi:hypothetical protein
MIQWVKRSDLVLTYVAFWTTVVGAGVLLGHA